MALQWTNYRLNQVADLLRGELQNIKTLAGDGLSQLPARTDALVSIRRAKVRLDNTLTTLQNAGFLLNDVGEAFTEQFDSGRDWTTEVKPEILLMRTALDNLVTYLQGITLSNSWDADGGRQYDVPLGAQENTDVVALLTTLNSNFA